MERASVGLGRPGKREVLAAFRGAVAARGGRVLLNEADIYCDVGLAPGDALLRGRLVDSHVRRFAASLLRDLADATDTDLRARQAAVVRDWALGQVAVADAPVEQRDVYELRPLLAPARRRGGAACRGASVHERWLLFHQYVLAAA